MSTGLHLELKVCLLILVSIFFIIIDKVLVRLATRINFTLQKLL